jgi:TetR/AcrR family transcriptional regulator, mexJK operon transcriptional repressor
MPARDEVEYEKKRQQIIDAALSVFAEKGFEKATNRDIARAAGIASPGLIYHYFADKADLLQKTIATRSPALRLLSQEEAMMTMQPRQALELVGAGFLARMVDQPINSALFRVIISEALIRPAVAEMWATAVTRPAFHALSSYLTAQIKAGRLRPVEVGAAVRSFLGPFIIYVMMREVFPQTDPRPLDPQTMVRTAVDIFLRGVEVSPELPGGTTQEVSSTP